MNGIIYRAYDEANKSYVGQTCKTLEERIKLHYRHIKDGQYFHEALLEKGVNSFKWEVLEYDIPEELLNNRERYWIEYFNSFNDGYNRTKGGGTSPLTRRFSEKTLEKIREKSKIRYNNKSPKEKRPHSGWKLSDETKAKMSAAKRKMSAETKAKMSAAKKGKHRVLVDGLYKWIS